MYVCVCVCVRCRTFWFVTRTWSSTATIQPFCTAMAVLRFPWLLHTLQLSDLAGWMRKTIATWWPILEEAESSDRDGTRLLWEKTGELLHVFKAYTFRLFWQFIFFSNHYFSFAINCGTAKKTSIWRLHSRSWRSDRKKDNRFQEIRLGIIIFRFHFHIYTIYYLLLIYEI